MTEDYSSEIKSLQLRIDNSECIECNRKGTTYFVPSIGTFICSRCAGILRELNIKVKGISVCHFDEKEYRIATLIGNTQAKKIYMYKCNRSKYDTENDNMLKKFLRDKYIKKMYLNRNKEYKQFKSIIEEDSDSESEEEEEGENESESSYEEEEEESDEGEEEEDEKEDENVKKFNLTKITEMNIKKPTNVNINTGKKFEEIQKEKEQWSKLWEGSEAMNRPVNVKDFEFDSNKDNT